MKRWTPKLAAARSGRRIDAAIKKLRDIAYDWGDIDNSVILACDELVTGLDGLRETVSEARTLQEAGQ